MALHLTNKDSCPNAVLERMSLSIGHVYSNSGGTPELIRDSGIGLDTQKIGLDRSCKCRSIDRGHQIRIRQKEILGKKAFDGLVNNSNLMIILQNLKEFLLII